MKTFVIFTFVFATFAVVCADDCPPGEQFPGPFPCGLEPTCAPRSSHFIPKHTCDCWCIPGTYRDLDTDKCVLQC